MKNFYVTPDHIRLLKHVKKSSDPKRPYGGTDIIHDIHAIISSAHPPDNMSAEENSEYYLVLHKEMNIVKQIFSDCGNLTVGMYVERNSRWILCDDPRPIGFDGRAF